MTMKRWNGAAFQDLATAKRWDGASWVDLTVAKRWDGASWVDIPLPGGGGSLSATADKAAIDGLHIQVAPGPLFRVVTTSGTVTVTATGGSGGGPTYAWTRVSGDSAVQADSPTSATTSFSGSVGRNQAITAVYRCTVVRGAETRTVDISVTLEYVVEDAEP